MPKTIDLSDRQTVQSDTAVAVPAPAPVVDKPVYTTFRDFNNSSFEARISFTEVKSGQYGEYVVVTAITNLKDGDDGVAIQFRSNSGTLKLAKNGHLMKGRRIHVTGNVTGIASSYQKDGTTIALARPRIELANVTIQLGAKPRAK